VEYLSRISVGDIWNIIIGHEAFGHGRPLGLGLLGWRLRHGDDEKGYKESEHCRKKTKGTHRFSCGFYVQLRRPRPSRSAGVGEPIAHRHKGDILLRSFVGKGSGWNLRSHTPMQFRVNTPARPEPSPDMAIGPRCFDKITDAVGRRVRQQVR